MTLRQKLWLMIAIIVLAVSLAAALSLQSLRRDLIQSRRTEATHLVEIGYSVLDHYGALAQAGMMSEAVAQTAASDAISALRYEGGNYFILYDLDYKMVRHPFHPEMNGRDQRGLKDSNGVYLIVDLIDAAKRGKGEFVEYLWPKTTDTKPVEKISTSRLYKPWGWIVATGIYVDDVEVEFTRKAWLVVGEIGAGLAILLLAVWAIAKSITDPLERLRSKMTQIAASGDLTVVAPPRFKGEIGDMAAAFFSLIDRLRELNANLEQRVLDRTSDLNHALTEQQAILNNALTGIAFMRNRVIQRCNEGFEKMLGFEPGELKGKSTRIIHATDAAYEALGQSAYPIIQSGAGFFSDIRLCRKDGTEIWCTSHAKVVDPADPEQGVVWVVQDISARKATEQALAEARDRAEEATRSKSLFLANMSHEIRTPMNAVIGLAHLALQTPLNPKQRDYVGKIHRAGQSLLGIINDILDFSKIEAGKLDVEITDFSLDEVLANVATVTSQKAADKEIEYLFHVPPEVPRHLQGDPLRLGQVLTNLVNNAVKFTETGGEIEVAIGVVEQGSDTVALHFTIRDTGIGMSAEQQTKLFQPFSQADGSTTRKFGGTGLGLSISQRLVELMGGRIGVTSQLGVGSVFHFDLRFDLSTSGAQRGVLPAGINGSRVLVVDDSTAARMVLSEALKALPIHVDSVDSGKAALTAIRETDLETPYDLVLTDWQMPGMDGLALIQAVKADDALKNPPKMVLVTAFGRDEVQREADDAGADGLLFKPVGPSALVDTLVEVFNTSNRQTSPQHAVHDRRFVNTHILLAEDNSINQQIATELLEMVGITVDIAENGQEAVELAMAAKQDTYAMVLMDLQMPIMDGHEATIAIRQDKRLSHVPIVALTAHAIGDIRDRCMKDGMQDYLTKPIHPEALFELLDRWLGKQAVKSDTESSSKHEPAAAPIAKPKATVGKTTASSAPDASPELDLSLLTELNTAQGLQFMGGKRSLYMRLLERFRSGQADTVQRLASMIEKQEYEEAERLVHTLKGLAGSMGAKHVQASADILENALMVCLRDGHALQDAQILQENLGRPLTLVLAQLNAVLPAPPAAAKPAATPEAISMETVQSVLKELSALLGAFSGKTLPYFESQQAALAVCFDADTLARLDKHIRNFEFEEAEEIMQTAKLA